MRIDDLRAGAATPLVLTILSEGDSHGFAIVERVRERTGAPLPWADAMVYPLLHRLHRLGYVTSEWRPLPDGRRRRFYALTDGGRTALARQRHRRLGAQGAWNSGGRGHGGLLPALSGSGPAPRAAHRWRTYERHRRPSPALHPATA